MSWLDRLLQEFPKLQSLSARPATDLEAAPASTTEPAAVAVDDPQQIAALLTEAIIECKSQETDAAPTPASMLERMEELGRQFADLKQLYETRIHGDDLQAKAMQKMHAQLQEHKTNFVRQQMEPLLKEVIFCHDFLAQELSRWAMTGQPPTPASVEHARQSLIDLLFKYDVEPFCVEGVDFDRARQQCVATAPTPTADLDKHIADRRLVGFRAGEQILRREQVVLFKHQPSTNPPPAEES